MDGNEAVDNSREWYLARIKEEIQAGRTQNALSYVSVAITVAEKRDYGFDPATCGIIELAIRNPNVMSYMKEWEARAEKAEAERVQLWNDNRDLRGTIDVEKAVALAERYRAEAAEATCEKLAAALDQCQRALAAMIDPSCIAQTTVIYAFATATTAEATARHVLAAYRKEASNAG